MSFAGPNWKPAKGTALIAARDRRRERVKHEQREMQAAKQRDGHVCRNPGCTMRSKDLPIDPCHVIHRGSGGNPSGDRTQRRLIVSLCRWCHGLFDRGDLAIEFQTVLQCDGPMDFYERSESGRLELFASETTIGVSVERGR